MRSASELNRRSPGLTCAVALASAAGTAVGQPVEVRVKGEDPDVSSSIADLIKDRLARYEGVVEIDDDMTPGKSELRVSVLQDRAALYGLTVARHLAAVLGRASRESRRRSTGARETTRST